ncbi:leucine-rich repeat domain-containing protein, partial [Aeromonas caviae]
MHTLEQLRAGELCGARHLKLAENLAVFPPEILSLKETLEVLDLTGNQLSELPDALAECKKLRILFCSENNFTELPEVLGRCPALTMVGFKANRIATVPAASLPARLRWLILTD